MSFLDEGFGKKYRMDGLAVSPFLPNSLAVNCKERRLTSWPGFLSGFVV